MYKVIVTILDSEHKYEFGTQRERQEFLDEMSHYAFVDNIRLEG